MTLHERFEIKVGKKFLKTLSIADSLKLEFYYKNNHTGFNKLLASIKEKANKLKESS